MTVASSAPQRATAHDGQARTRDGTAIAYTLIDAGPGAPRLALVHSLAMDRSFWRPVIDQLAGKASVLMLDCRGHGASGKPAGPYTVELFADDLADLLDHVGWRSATVAGASMGGCVSLAFAARHPQRTSGLGLIDTTACYDAMPAWVDRASKAKQEGLASLIGFQVTRWFGDAFREQNKDVVQASVDVFLRNDIAAYAETCLMLGACDLRKALPGIKTPAAVIVGEEDYATPVKMAQELHDGIAGSTLTVLDGARHLTPIERPGTIAKELLRIARLGRSGMKIVGELSVRAPRQAVFDALKDAHFFASCVDGVQELTEIDPTHYAAVFETKIAYMKFKFNVTVEMTKAEPPGLIEGKVEGKPMGLVGRLTATATTRLTEDGDATKIAYEIDSALTGKLGAMGQPVLKAKAKELEKQFAERLKAKFEP